MSQQKKFRFEDLQPHVDMLCDALENKGASASGVPYNKEVYVFADQYRDLLNKLRNKQMGYTEMLLLLHNLSLECVKAANTNQRYRIFKIVAALDFFIKKEYNKVYN